LKNSGITLSPMLLDQRKSLSGPTVGDGIERRGPHPEVIARTQYEHGHNNIVNDLHNQGEEYGRLVE
jgi:hypothetical protein